MVIDEKRSNRPTQSRQLEKALGQTRHLPQRELEQPLQGQAQLNHPVGKA